MKKRLMLGVLVTAALLIAIPALVTPVAAAPPTGEPIVIGYVGMILSPGTRPCMDIQKIAVEEINQAGGILGRPVKYIVADNKGDTSLTVEGARRLLIEDKAKFISVEGRTEICLAAQENSAAMFKNYPHILIFNGPMGAELTSRVLDEYDKYKFCFRDWDPEPAHYPQMNYFWGTTWPQMFPNLKRMAFLWEDLAWTTQWREGIDYLNMPPWEELLEKKHGIDVVYSKAVKPRGTMYMPLLQQIAMKKAQVILYISSWFTDTESFTKQWAESAARDIPVNLYGGVAQTSDFWAMTGGKALGVISSFTECELPLTEKTIPFVQMAKKKNIPTQIHVHLAYADIYFFKKVIENAGGIDDIDKLINAMETSETTYSLGKMAYETKKMKPYFHSKVRIDLSDPMTKTIPGAFYQPIAQFQNNGKIQYLGASCVENEPKFKGVGSTADYVYPAELRKR
ncbi:MAG: ABC transporter substrate-binding protein [Syntrophales bacterium]|nr:ABC transporter substrate-binding protein [Syntrophales bacterium]